MAFFKFRKSGDAPQPDAPPTSRRSVGKNAAAAEAETVDALRRRARHRLIGAVVLVLVVVIGFPLVFDTQPRPVAVQAPILIPDRNTAPALNVPPPAPAVQPAQPVQPIQPAQPVPPAPAPATPPPAASVQQPPATATTSSSGTIGTLTAPPAAPAADDSAARAEQARKEREARAAQQARAEQQAKARAEQQAREQREAQRKREQEAARAQALLEGRGQAPHAAAPAGGKPAAADGKRYIIQIGAYTEAAGIRTARQKAERAGVPTVEQEIHTAEGKRTRVRAGPFAGREAAEQAAAKLKRAGLNATILAL